MHVRYIVKVSGFACQQCYIVFVVTVGSWRPGLTVRRDQIHNFLLGLLVVQTDW